MKQVSCPWCFEFTSIRRSRARWQDVPRYLFGMKPYRCKKCGNRFYRRGTFTTFPQKENAEQTQNQTVNH